MVKVSEGVSPDPDVFRSDTNTLPPRCLAIDPPPAPAADDRMDPLRREDADNPQAARIAELVADGWAPWNAKARAETEALPGWQQPP